jgi:hypothetical protein
MAGKITAEKVGNAIGLAALISIPFFVAFIVYMNRRNR